MLLLVMQQSEAATFGQVLRYWRTQAGRSLRDVETTSGMSATNLSRIERGLIAPPPNFVLDKLAAAIGVGRAVLYTAAGGIPPGGGKGGLRPGVQAASREEPVGIVRLLQLWLCRGIVSHMGQPRRYGQVSEQAK